MSGIRDIAERAGVSISTVSNVLHNKNSASAKTREKILAIAAELGYEMPMAKKRGNHTVICNLSDFDALYYLDILHGISDYTNAKGYSMLICSGENIAHYADPEVVCGCIVNDVNTADADLLKVAEKGIPVIVLDREIDSPRIKSIVVNNYAAEKQLIEGLIEAGYQRFAFLAGRNTDDNKDRYAAFRDTLKEHGLTFRRNDYFEGDWREKSGAQAARLLMLSEEMPEIVVCSNDMMALGAIRLLSNNGLRIPDDIAVAGFDDIIISRYTELTTVTVPDYERGYLAAQALIDILDGKGDFETVRIGARVKWRKTTKNFRKK
ncbi:MAG: LacI family DNA-binding transcriptional regulator [Lachnospiraceae bacterium]|nr:LacI family DNA-binding transcriptional regulator [Lachnospiraceae bacterium]